MPARKIRQPVYELVQSFDSAVEELVIERLRFSENGWIEIGGDESPGVGICGHRGILYS